VTRSSTHSPIRSGSETSPARRFASRTGHRAAHCQTHNLIAARQDIDPPWEGGEFSQPQQEWSGLSSSGAEFLWAASPCFPKASSTVAPATPRPISDLAPGCPQPPSTVNLHNCRTRLGQRSPQRLAELPHPRKLNLALARFIYGGKSQPSLSI
jgi:hypothetical protein